MPSPVLVDAAKAALPLVSALAEGRDLEFRRNSGEWTLCTSMNLSMITMAPQRYRIVVPVEGHNE